MKICIISTVAPRQMSMYSIYTRYFMKHGIKYDLIYLDRFSGSDSVKSENTFRFDMKDRGRLSRYFSYYSFSKYAKRTVRSNKYDYLIIWNEMTAGWMSRFLVKEYKKRYCINIRDLFDENYILTKLIQPKLNLAIKYSDFNTVSSKGYIKFLPPAEYIEIHSLNEDFCVRKKGIQNKKDGEHLTIMYVGNIRFLEKLKAFLDLFKNDDRFSVVIAGSGSSSIEEYCKSIGAKNVSFIGTFLKEETSEVISKADILYNLYGTENNCLRTALSQKLYLAISMRIPILVYNKTSMYDYANECGLAFGIEDKCELDRDIPRKLYDWYNSLDLEEIEIKCIKMENEIKKCNLLFTKKLDMVFLKKQGDSQK